MTRVNVRVRSAELADVPGLVELTCSFDVSSGAFTGKTLSDEATAQLTARIAAIVSEGERTVLVAVDDATCGLVGVLVARNDEVGAIELTPVLHVTHLIVSPKQRRHGIGRALLAAAVHLADERGVDRVVAAVASGSRESNRYLARLGFAPLVVQRVASTSALRRSLGMADAPGRIAVLRRARLVRAQRARPAARVAQRGA